MTTYFGSAAAPSDTGSQADSSAHNVTPPASMAVGDLVVVYNAARVATESFSISNSGGQSWQPGTLRQGNSLSVQMYWCRFNGTWSANPSFRTAGQTGIPYSIVMHVFRPTSGASTWALDQAEAFSAYSAPVSPYDVTATGQTPVAASTVSLATFVTIDQLTWALQTGGFANAGTAQYRNDNGADISVSTAYKIQTSAVTTGNVTNRQGQTTAADAPPDQGLWLFATFREQSSGLTVTGAGDGLYYHTEAGLQIDGAGFSPSGNTVKISPTNNVADGAAVSQTITAESATQITFTANLSSFTPFAQLYLFVVNGSAQSNSTGFPIKRQSRMKINALIANIAGTSQTNLTGIHYRISKTLNGTALLSGTDETTNGTGILDTDYYALTEGGELAPNDDVIIQLFKPGSPGDGHISQISPTYS